MTSFMIEEKLEHLSMFTFRLPSIFIIQILFPHSPCLQETWKANLREVSLSAKDGQFFIRARFLNIAVAFASMLPY